MYLLGYGRRVKPKSRIREAVESVPFLGKPLARLIWKPYPIYAEHVERRFFRRKVIRPDNYNMFVVGKAGTGKSSHNFEKWQEEVTRGATLQFNAHRQLLNMQLAWLAANNVPPEDVALIDFGDHSFGTHYIDLFETLPGQSREEGCDGLTSDMEAIADIRGAAGFRQADLFRFGFRALSEAGAPFSSADRFYGDETLRHAVLSRCEDPDTLRVWNYVHTMLLKRDPLVLESARNKVSPICASRYVAPVFSKRQSTCSFFDCFQNKKHVLVDVSRNTLGEEVRAITARLLLSKISAALEYRDRLPESEWKPVALFLDEMAAYFCPSVPFLYNEARKWQVKTASYLQTCAQIPHDFLLKMFGGVSIYLALKVDYEDAVLLARRLHYPTGDKARDFDDKKFHTFHDEYDYVARQLMTVPQLHGYVTSGFDLARIKIPMPKVPKADVREYRRAIAEAWGYLPQPDEEC